MVSVQNWPTVMRGEKQYPWLRFGRHDPSPRLPPKTNAPLERAAHSVEWVGSGGRI
jgi:hypothetical protein